VEDRFATLSLEILKVERIPDGSRPIAKLLQDWGLGKQPQEVLWVISYDASGSFRTVVEVARGGHTEMEVHIPSLLTAVLATGAGVFTVAHNHPIPITPLPSVSDHNMNHAIMAAANACGLVYEESLIVCPTQEYFSFRDAGLILPAPRGGGRPLNVKKAASATRRSQ
jgi:DNA repair protein RadC